MRFHRWGGTILLFVLSAAFLSAQSPSSLTEEQAVHEALAANLGLQGEGIKSGIKKRDRDQAWSRLYPTVSVGGGYVNLDDTKANAQAVAVGGGNAIEFTPAAANIALSFSAQLAISPATFAAIDQTAIDYDNSKISYDLAAQRLTRDVKKIFFQIEVLQATIALTEKQLANAEERYRQAQVNFKTGLAPQLTVLQAQVAWQNQKPGLEDLKVNTQQALFTFENLLGRTPDADLKLVGSLDVTVPANALQAQPLLDKFMDRRLDLKAAEGQVRAADGYKKIADQALFPALVLQYTADPTLNDPFGVNKSNWGDTSKWLQPTGVFAVLLNWRLDTFVPGSSSDNQRSDSADQGRLARTALDQLKLSAKTEIITLVNKIQKSTVAFGTLSANVDVALQAYKLTEDAYKSGARSLLEVQDAELQYQVAQLSLLNEKQLYHSNLLDLETALNSTSEEIYGR
jgi:outer membrane protein TolC